MLKYNLFECSDIRKLWNYHRDEVNDAANDAEVLVPLKYLSNFWRSLSFSLIHCEIQLDLT